MLATGIGQAGEYFTLFDLSSKDYNCFLVNESLCFDIGMTDKFNSLYRVQVKTTSKKRNKHSYQFRLVKSHREFVGYGEKGNYKGRSKYVRHSDKHYNVTDFEILALVILPKKKVFYIPFHAIHGQKYLNLRGNEDLSLDNCLNSIREAEGKNNE